MAPNANSELRVVTAAKNLCSYVLMVTSKSPKSFRFTLVSRLQNLSLDIIENIYKANEALYKVTTHSMCKRDWIYSILR